MKIWRACYVLTECGGKITLFDSFDFSLYGDNAWEKYEDGYICTGKWSWSGGYSSSKVSNNIGICQSLIVNEKYFERELTQEELIGLKKEMKRECIKALEEKKQIEMIRLQEQIDFIKKGL